MRGILFMLALCACSFALVPGRYTDWKWDYEYSNPSRPAEILNSSNCNTLIGDDSCSQIVYSSLSENEKRFIIIQMKANKSSSRELVDYAGNWNKGIAFGRYSPEGSQVYNGQAIRNAWIATFFDSVTDLNNKTWVRNGTEINERHNIEMVVENLSEESCDIIYSIAGYDYSIETFVDGQKQDGNALYFQKKHGDSIEIGERMSFAAEWSADIWKWKNETVCGDVRECHLDVNATVCSTRHECWTETKCEYDHTETFMDEDSVSDRRTVYFYDESFDALNYFENNSTGWFAGTFPEGEGIELKIGNSIYSSRLNHYSLAEDPAMRPYGILRTAVAQNSAYDSASGICVLRGTSQREMPNAKQSAVFQRMNSGNEIYSLVNYETGDPGNCTVFFDSHFSRIKKDIDCGRNGLRTEIDISLQNITNETALAEIRLYNPSDNSSLAGKDIGIAYNFSEYNGTTDADGTYEFYLNRTDSGSFMAVRFETDLETPSASKRVFVDGKKMEFDFSGLIMLGLLGSGYYVAYKKFISGVGGLA
jgi:hypothetical protein